MIGLDNLHHPFDQSDERLKPTAIETSSPSFPAPQEVYEFTLRLKSHDLPLYPLRAHFLGCGKTQATKFRLLLVLVLHLIAERMAQVIKTCQRTNKLHLGVLVKLSCENLEIPGLFCRFSIREYNHDIWFIWSVSSRWREKLISGCLHSQISARLKLQCTWHVFYFFF